MSDQPPPKSFPFQTFFGAVLTVVLAASLFLVLQRLSGIEEKMAQLGEQVDATLKRLDAVDRRAQEAEASAQQAARLRDQAEERAVQARLETNQAQDEASQARREAGLARQDADQARKEREAELDRLQAALNRIVETRRTALGLVMNLGSDSLQFDFDKAALRPENREILSRVAGILFTFQDYAISVYGHTDDVGNARYNQQLSERRAETVRDYLVQAGIDSSIITAKGFGKSRPLVESRTPQARAENRRVEIGIVNTRVLYTEPVSKTPH
ncbi:MAG: OmpA family protein [Acidobacteriota bacterium]